MGTGAWGHDMDRTGHGDRGLGDVGGLGTSGLGDAATNFQSIEFQKWENILT